MRRSISAALLIAATSVLSSAVSGQTPTADPRPGIAVFPLYYGGSYGDKKEDLSALSIGLQQRMIHELAANPVLRVVERTDIKKLLDEQDLGASGRVEAATAAKIGKLVGARYAVIGDFTDLFGEFTLGSRIVDVQTSEVLKSDQVSGEIKKMSELLRTLAARLPSGVRLAELPRQVADARKKSEIPPEAVIRYSRILQKKDRGDDPKEIRQLYKQLSDDFPLVEEFKAELKQLGGD
jgi:TolB-like protein